jgi:predicted regulator of Ras-like GTPase activity (Roadblock/LC7/MglB family)
VEKAATPNLLGALRDIDGVLGSFIVDGEGRVVARDVPLLFEAAALGRAAEHLARLRAALESEGGSLSSCVARFGDHLLIVRAVGADTLGVLCPRGTNLPAVQMGCTLVTRRLCRTRETANTEDADLRSPTGERRFRGQAL